MSVVKIVQSQNNKVVLQSVLSLSGGSGGGAVSSVNGQTGTVTLNADNIPDGTTTNKYITQAEINKLSAIEANATADQTAGEIKTAYESNLDTNAYTNSEQSKLSGVETGATANSTDATLLNRANHTSTQTVSTISDFNSEADARIAASDKVSSDPSAVTGADAVTNMMSLTQTEFDAIGTPDAKTVYFIEE